MSTSKSSSVLINNTGALSSPPAVQPVHHQNSARVREIMDLAANVFIRKPAELAMDPRLTLSDKAIWEAVELLRFIFGKCNEPLEVIGAMVGVSKRQAIDSVKVLIAAGRMTRVRSLRSSMPDVLENVRPSREVSRESRGKLPGRCAKCSRQQVVDSMGICSICRKQEVAEREVSQFLENGPASLEIVYLTLKANGSKSGQKAIHRAYLKSTAA